MTDENNGTGDNTDDPKKEEETGQVDHMAEMAALIEEEAGQVDHMAEMAALMEEGNASSDEESTEQNAEVIAREISGKDVNIETLLKVPVSLAIEVGRTQMLLSDLLDTQEGSVIELERLLDDPLDILVNGALIAHGVVVLANESFGIQITDIISLQDRAKSL